MTLSLGSINFNNDVPDGNGVLWYVNVDGWDTLAQRTDDIPFVARYGNRVTQNLYEARQLTLFGTAVMSDGTAYWDALNTLNSVTNKLTPFLDTPLLLTISEEVDKQMTVLRTGLHSTCIDVHILQFELNLRADDPLKYATIAKTASANAGVNNAGTARTFPTFTTVAVDLASLEVGSPGPTWFTNGPLPTGTVIDMGAMTVFNGSTSYIQLYDPSSTWLDFPPGASATNSATDSAGVWTWRDAWL